MKVPFFAMQKSTLRHCTLILRSFNPYVNFLNLKLTLTIFKKSKALNFLIIYLMLSPENYALQIMYLIKKYQFCMA